jgi:hypothetical protein
MSDLDCIIQMVGGLGNQMFQYALGRRLQTDRGANVRYDLGMYKHNTERALTLSRLRTRFAEVSQSDKLTMKLSFGRTFSKAGALLGPLKNKLLWRVHEDPANGIDPEVTQLRGRWYLRGWYQCPAYFEKLRPQLLQEFDLAEPLTGANAELLKKIEAVNAVCLHVRRGDLVTNPLYAKEQQVQTADYYSQCLTDLAQRVNEPHIFVFSDDLPWCRANLHPPMPINFMDKNDGSTDYIDLHLMSRCRHFITANSTFSWWAAWLSQNPEKIIIVPPVWRFKDNGPPPDLIPGDWQIGPRVEKMSKAANALQAGAVT